MSNYKNILVNHSPIDSSVVYVADTAEAILKATDWTQLPDSGLTDACVALFATYRTSIRNIRKNPTNPTWPNAPTEEWS